MKKISGKSIGAYLTVLTTSLGLAGTLTYGLLSVSLNLSTERELTYVATFAVIFYAITIGLFRLWLRVFPTPMGLTSDKDVWHVHAYQLFYLILFNPILKSFILPIPLMRAFYLSIGAKMGDNSYTGGIIYDAHLVSIGKNCILGEASLLTPHQIEGQDLGYYPILIGNDVTVGAHAVILPGVTIEDNAIVASGAIVSKGTYIKRGEVWGGVPAKRLKVNSEAVIKVDKDFANEIKEYN